MASRLCFWKPLSVKSSSQRRWRSLRATRSGRTRAHARGARKATPSCRVTHARQSRDRAQACVSGRDAKSLGTPVSRFHKARPRTSRHKTYGATEGERCGEKSRSRGNPRAVRKSLEVSNKKERWTFSYFHICVSCYNRAFSSSFNSHHSSRVCVSHSG